MGGRGGGGYAGVQVLYKVGGSRDCILEVGGFGLKVFGLWGCRGEGSRSLGVSEFAELGCRGTGFWACSRTRRAVGSQDLEILHSKPYAQNSSVDVIGLRVGLRDDQSQVASGMAQPPGLATLNPKP